MKYPAEFHEFMAEYVTGRTTVELAALASEVFGIEFTPTMCKAYKNNHHLKSGIPGGRRKGAPTDKYPEQVRLYIQENHAGTSPADMATQLNEAFGTAYTTVQIRMFYKNNCISSGIVARFRPGNVPHNKGKKGIYAPGCEKTWFQPGSKPSDTLPLGTITTKADGYLWKKIDEKPGDWRQNWKQLHLIVWEEEHGPIPEGGRVIFLDGDKGNCSPENLHLVTMAENLEMTRRGLRTSDPELTRTGALIAKVECTARKIEKERKRNGSRSE